jgi:predicted nucleic acid-binding protein
MVLVDTSVWVATFARRQPLDLEAVVDFDAVVTCLPVLQEVLQGFRDETAFRRARQAMLALPIVEAPLPLEVVSEAVQLYRLGRAAGHTIRSSVDCLIAACALRHDLEVVHRDRDYAAIAAFSALRQRRV